MFDTAKALADFTLVRMFYTVQQQRLGAGVFVRTVRCTTVPLATAQGAHARRQCSPPPRAAVPCRCGCGAPCRHVDQVRERLQAAAEGLPQPGWEPIEEPATPELPGDKLGPRMVLYSAHDTTLAAVLSALGLFDGCVDPAAVWCR